MVRGDRFHRTASIVLRARRGKWSSAGGARSLRRKSARDRRAPHSILRRLSLGRGEGVCVGTLCLLDTRPRELTTREHQLLRDLGQLVAQELKGGWALTGREGSRATTDKLAE